MVLLFAVPAAARQQPAQQPSPVTYGYTVFVGGTVVGREDVTVEATAAGVTITGKGRLSGSLDIVMRRAEVRYGADWTPETLELEATVNGGDTVLQTTFSGRTAVTRGVDGGQRVAETTDVPARIVILPNVFFGSYEALTRRLASASPDQEFAAFLGAGRQGALRLASVSTERMQIGTSMFDVRRYVLTFTNPRGTSILNLFADENHSLLRVNIPAQGLDVMREDVASSTARTLVYSKP